MTTCAHLDTPRPAVTPDPPDGRACVDCLREGTRWVHLRELPRLRPRRLLRQQPAQARDGALPRHRAPGHDLRRAGRGLALVLRGRRDRGPRVTARPVLLSVDDDPSVSRAIARDLRRRYGDDYRVVRAESGPDALDVAARADRARRVHRAAARRPPDARHDRRRLPRAGDGPRAGGQAGPADGVRRHRRRDPRDQRRRPRPLPAQALGPAGGAALPGPRRAAARAWRAQARAGLRGRHPRRPPVVGARPRWPRSSWPATRCPTATSTCAPTTAQRLLAAARLDGDADALPVVLLPDGEVLRRPTVRELAERVGLATTAGSPFYDVVVVGGGPGRARARRSTPAARACAPCWSSRPPPAGRPGSPAGSRTTSASRRACPAPSSRSGPATRPSASRSRSSPRRSAPASSRAARAGSCASPTAARSPRTPWCSRPASPTPGCRAPGVDDFAGRGVYYGAAAHEAVNCRGQVVHVVGAANSAGQAALHFAEVRRRGRAAGARRRPAALDVGVPRRAHRGARATSRSAPAPRWRARQRRRAPRAARPARTPRPASARRSRPPGCSCSSARAHAPTGSATAFRRDERGFLLTGPDLLGARRRARRAGWPLDRDPYLLEAERARRVRRRRRPGRVGEAGRLRRRRGRPRRHPRAPLPGRALMTAPAGDPVDREELRTPVPVRGAHRRAARLARRRAAGGGRTTPARRSSAEGGTGNELFVLLDGGAADVAAGQRRGRRRQRDRLPRRLRGAVRAYVEADAPYANSVTATRPSSFFVLPGADFGTFMRTWFPMAVHLLDGLFLGRAQQRGDGRASASTWPGSAPCRPTSRTSSTTRPRPTVRASGQLRDRVAGMRHKLGMIAEGRVSPEVIARLVACQEAAVELAAKRRGAVRTPAGGGRPRGRARRPARRSSASPGRTTWRAVFVGAGLDLDWLDQVVGDVGDGPARRRAALAGLHARDRVADGRDRGRLRPDQHPRRGREAVLLDGQRQPAGRSTCTRASTAPW